MKFTLKQIDEVQLQVEGQGWDLKIDAPPEFGGKSLGPTATEMLAISLGACKLVTGLIWARLKGIKVDGLTVAVEADYADAPRRIGRIRVAVRGVGDRLGDKKDRFVAVMNACPVANTLKHPPQIELEVS